jgi:hypothetical protein
MKLIAKGRTPYGGSFVVRDPLSGQEIRASRFEVLVSRVIAARKANGLPVGLDIEAEIETWCCLSHPDECVDMDPAMPKRRRLTLTDVVHGAKVMASFLVGGSRLVSAEEAERRASVCAKCPLNLSYSRPCSVCAELRNLVLSMVGNKKTSQDDKLQVCNICSCELRAAVWLQLEDQCKGVTSEMKPAFDYAGKTWGCWKASCLDATPSKE